MDEDQPRPRSGKYGAASQLASESLDGYSLDELDARRLLLEAEIARVTGRRASAADHLAAADALFRARPDKDSR